MPSWANLPQQQRWQIVTFLESQGNTKAERSEHPLVEKFHTETRVLIGSLRELCLWNSFDHRLSVTAAMTRNPL